MGPKTFFSLFLEYVGKPDEAISVPSRPAVAGRENVTDKCRSRTALNAQRVGPCIWADAGDPALFLGEEDKSFSHAKTQRCKDVRVLATDRYGLLIHKFIYALNWVTLDSSIFMGNGRLRGK